MTMFQQFATEAGLHASAGKQAMSAGYRGQVTVAGRYRFTESVDLDQHFSNAEPNANRWDYGVGFKHENGEFIIWIEPHPASSSKEVDVILKKLAWLKSKLRSRDYDGLYKLTYAREDKNKRPFRWIYSGAMNIKRGSKEAKRLAQKGMKLPERRIEIG